MLVKLSAAGFSAVLLSYCFADQTQSKVPSTTDQQVRPNIVTPPKPPAPGTDLREAAKNQAAEQMPSMMPMSLVAPMFVEDATTANTLTIVHDASTQATAEIAIVNLLGQKVAVFSKPIATHGQTVVVLADELAKLGIVGPLAGSLIATPTPSNVSLAGQLSIVRKGVETQDIEEELPMIDSSRRNAFTALATGATGDPIIALRSSSSQSQTLSITCIAQDQTSSRTQRILLPNQGLFIDPCTGQDTVPTLQNDKQVFSKPSVVGVMIESTGHPGSLSVFGVAPRSISPFLTYEPLQFQQTGAIGQLTNVYNGVPLGPTDELQGVDYQPEVGLTNFGSASVHVSLALAKSASGQPQSLANVTVPPNASMSVPLPEIIGDPGMANTVTMQSDATDLQLISNLRVISKADRLHFVEIPNKNLTKSTNGGQHPWILNKTTNSKVYLYNGTPETINPTVRVYTGSQTWVMAIKLVPSETKVLDIRALFISKVKDSKGRILTGVPDNGIEGIVSWSSLKTKSLHGRVTQIDGAALTTRNFACDVVYIACGASWDPFDFYTYFQQTASASGGANECPSVGACTCDGSSCPGGTLSEADTYYWFVYDTSIAPITAGTYSAQASLFGNSAGQTTLELGVGDSSGCSASGEGPVVVATLSCSSGTPTRGDSVTCSLSGNAPADSWTFTPTGTSNPTVSSTGGNSWSGPMVTSGTVTATMNGTSTSASIQVMPRGGFVAAMPPQPAGPSTNGTQPMATLTSPPSGDEGSFGQSAYRYNFSVAVSGFISAGPNSGYRYVTSFSDSSTYIYEMNPGLTDSNDDFYVHQYGNCGIPSVAQIVSAIQQHEYSGSPSHYSYVAASLSSNNPGTAAEAVVDPPAQASSIQNDAINAATAAYNAALSAGATEPPTNLPGNINFPPYSSCP